MNARCFFLARRDGLALIACSVLLCPGCADRREPSPAVWQAQSLQAILRQAAQREAMLRRLDAQGRVVIETETGRESILIDLFVNKDDRFRLIGWSRIGPKVFDFLMKDGELSFHIPRDRIMYKGTAAGGKSDWALVGEALRLYFSGTWAKLENPRKEAETREEIRIVGTDAGARSYEIVVDGAGYLRELHVARDGRDLDLTLSGRKELDGVAVPCRLRVSAKQRGFKAVLHFREIVVNGPLEDGVFVLSAPAGTKVEHLP